MRTANPAFSESVFVDAQPTSSSEVMTLRGTVIKSGTLLLMLAVAAGFTWTATFGDTSGVAMTYTLGGAFVGFILAMVTIFKQTWSPVTAPLYAVAQGLFLGGISAYFEMQYPGIVIQAIGLTIGTAMALLLAYSSGLIRATENFKLGVFAATGGIALMYVFSIILGFFGVGIPFLHDSGPIGIGISLFIVVVAALNLVLDFDFIETGVERGAPKYMEWYASFGLLVTLVWLYLELLRLLSKLQSRD